MSKRKQSQRMPVVEHTTFPPGLRPWATEVYGRVGNLIYSTFDCWQEALMRDGYPVRELILWDVIADAREKYLANNPDADSTEVLALLFLISLRHQFPKDTPTIKALRSAFLDSVCNVAKNDHGTAAGSDGATPGCALTLEEFAAGRAYD